MTDDTDERPFQLSDGDCVVFDPGYLDVDQEIEGVLGVQWSVDRGLWVLVGSRDESDRYAQEWQPIASQKPGPRLRPVN